MGTAGGEAQPPPQAGAALPASPPPRTPAHCRSFLRGLWDYFQGRGCLSPQQASLSPPSPRCWLRIFLLHLNSLGHLGSPGLRGPRGGAQPPRPRPRTVLRPWRGGRLRCKRVRASGAGPEACPSPEQGVGRAGTAGVPPGPEGGGGPSGCRCGRGDTDRTEGPPPVSSSQRPTWGPRGDLIEDPVWHLPEQPHVHPFPLPHPPAVLQQGVGPPRPSGAPSARESSPPWRRPWPEFSAPRALSEDLASANGKHSEHRAPRTRAALRALPPPGAPGAWQGGGSANLSTAELRPLGRPAATSHPTRGPSRTPSPQRAGE